ncbi:MAG: S-layer homology domain-containing protein [Gorillibacterium sp.]|nr:S-layer homology domain-containing protein [Gorillibacterium sp.]
MEYRKNYIDIPAGFWAENAIRILAAKQITMGMDEGVYRPKAQITRAEFAALLARTLQLTPSMIQTFEDVKAEAWYNGEVGAAFNAKLVSGRNSKRFAPDEPISRQEMAVMLLKAYRYAGGNQEIKSSKIYSDLARISNWAVESVAGVTEIGLFNGYTDGSFKPDAFASRAEAAQVVANLLKKLP